MGLIARVFEREGLPTVSLTSARDITERVRPPRAAFLDFPLGNQAGRPRDPAGQRQILRDVLRLAETAAEPGAIADLPYVWPEPGWEEATRREYADEAHVVLRQRTTGEFHEGRHVYEQECRDVCSLA